MADSIPREPSRAYGPCIAVILFYLLWFRWKDPSTEAALLMGGGMAILTWLTYMGSSYSGEGSKLHGLAPIIERMPSITKPDGHVHFRTKMTWTLGILILYFALTNVTMYGLGPDTVDLFVQYRAILAGASGSLMHLGIGPIVTGSIIMQLFTGAKIINLNLQDAKDKAIYQGTQKVLVVVMIFVESIPQVFGFLEPSVGVVGELGLTWARMAIITQLIIGSYLVFLMDEVVSKWGIGSGISLFIAAGVSQALFTGTLNWEPAPGTTGPNSPPTGTIPMVIWYLMNSSSRELMQGGYVQVGYNVLSQTTSVGGVALTPYLRYEQVDTQARMPEGFERSLSTDNTFVTLGVELKPISNVVVKIDHAWVSNDAETGVDQFNVNMGYAF